MATPFIASTTRWEIVLFIKSQKTKRATNMKKANMN